MQKHPQGKHVPSQTGSQRRQPQKRTRPTLGQSRGTPVEQPSPEVCSQPPYVLICTVGMTPTCYGRVALHFNASRKACFALAVSDLALIILAEIAGSFAHEGINPQGLPTIPKQSASAAKVDSART